MVIGFVEATCGHCIVGSSCKGYNVGWFQWSFFSGIFEIIYFCFVVAKFELVQDVEAVFPLL